jgi:uncharacterized Zn-binding protein involved in type VI secretion
MPKGVLRVGDANTGGGLITVGDPTVLVNGRPIATVFSPVSPHPPCGNVNGVPHCIAHTQMQAGTVLVNRKLVATWPSVDTCLHPRATGSFDVIIGGV